MLRIIRKLYKPNLKFTTNSEIITNRRIGKKLLVVLEFTTNSEIITNRRIGKKLLVFLLITTPPLRLGS